MSYLQIKKFVDEQITLLNAPVIIDDKITRLLHQENVSESQIKSILFKCNLLLKRHNRTKFSKQVVHQIVQQVAKAEQENLIRVNDALSEVSRIVRPVMTDQFLGSGRLEDRIELLNNITEILPEGRYLFAIKSDEDFEDKSVKLSSGLVEPEEGLLVQDNAELVQNVEDKALREQYLEETKEKLDKQVGNQKENREMLRQKYDNLRSKLARINEEVVYKMEKLAYIKVLNKKMDFAKNRDLVREEKKKYGNDSDDETYGSDFPSNALNDEQVGGMGSQMSRFNVLIEKLEFALTSE